MPEPYCRQGNGELRRGESSGRIVTWRKAMRDGHEAMADDGQTERHTVESTLLGELAPSGLLVLIAMYGWDCCRFAMTRRPSRARL
jgi:hypothetical protein